MGQPLWTVRAKPGSAIAFSRDEWLIIGFGSTEEMANKFLATYKQKAEKTKNWIWQEFRIDPPTGQEIATRRIIRERVDPLDEYRTGLFDEG